MTWEKWLLTLPSRPLISNGHPTLWSFSFGVAWDRICLSDTAIHLFFFLYIFLFSAKSNLFMAS
jgi:hypothetical protein